MMADAARSEARAAARLAALRCWWSARLAAAGIGGSSKGYRVGGKETAEVPEVAEVSQRKAEGKRHGAKNAKFTPRLCGWGCLVEGVDEGWLARTGAASILRLSMRRIAQLAAVLLLLTTAMPVLACVAGSRMSREESACCRVMHGRCGNMAKMGCCRTELRTEQTPQIEAIQPTTQIQMVVVVDPWIPRVILVQAVVPARLRLPESYLPPGLMTARTTVLRI